MSQDNQDDPTFVSIEDVRRPRHRRDCLPGGFNEQRPCPFYGCTRHLGIVVDEETGAIKIRDIMEMVHTCDADVAEIGGILGSGRGEGVTLEEIGEIMSLTPERVRQIEAMGKSLCKPLLARRGLAPEHLVRPFRVKQLFDISDIDDGQSEEPVENPLAEGGEQD